MDVPFLSSGAVNRQHYALVRNVEESSTPEAADTLLQVAVHELRADMDTHAKLPLKHLKENLIILLYCLTSASSIVVSTKDLEFALPHAITLAEAGHNIRDKRIGYLFCTEVMSPGHELHLMLVNTIRKDLERPELPLICLALDVLVQLPTEEVVPAVQSRLFDLLSNNSPSIRKRALIVVQALAPFAREKTEFLEFFQKKIHKRLLDPDDFVAGSALLASVTLFKNVQTTQDAIHKRINKALDQLWSSGSRSRTRTWLTIRVLCAVQTVKLADSNIMVFQEIVQFAATSKLPALLRECLLLLAKLDSSQLQSSSLGRQTVVYVRDYLTSENPNYVWLFLETLEAIPAEYWSGSSDEYPAVLEAWEVERVMQLLQSPDQQLRKTTLRILTALDASIVSAYYTQALQNVPTNMSFRDRNEAARRLLEVADAMSKDDGESYAQAIREILQHFQPRLTADSEVLEGAVENVLLRVRNAESAFRVGCATTILTYAIDSSLECGATFMVIISAFGCEYVDQVAVRPSELLLCLSNRLGSCPVAVQDASLLAMLRISRECEEIPIEVMSKVSSLAEFSGRHIKRRCSQFSTLSCDKESLGSIVRNAASGSLPDFLDSLYSQQSQPKTTTTDAPSQEATNKEPKPGHSLQSRNSDPPQQLRYTAYESPPPPSPRMRRGRRLSSNGSSRRSESAYRSPVLSPGSLALAGVSNAWQNVPMTSPPALDIGAKQPSLSTARADLITLDSPFLDDPATSRIPEPASSQLTESIPGDDFEDAWNALGDQSGARGWYAGSMDDLVRLLQGVQYARLNVTPVDRAPFEGELKVRIVPLDTTPKSALLRIRESDEESCLWRMRCSDSGLRLTVKRLLAEE